MKYAEFLTAVQKNDEDKINEMYPKVFGVLVHFVEIRMGASRIDAEDAAQGAVLSAIESIRDGKITDGAKIIPYMMTSARNLHLKTITREHRFEPKDIVDSTESDVSSAFDALVSKEQQAILKQCVEQLKEDFKTFIAYWFEFPGIDAETVATHFEMSVSSVWVKKHRIVKLLRECVFTKI